MDPLLSKYGVRFIVRNAVSIDNSIIIDCLNFLA